MTKNSISNRTPVLAIILVVVFAAAGSGISDARELLAHRISDSLCAGTVMLSLALLIIYLLIVRSSRKADYRTL